MGNTRQLLLYHPAKCISKMKAIYYRNLGIGQLKSKTQTHDSVMVELTEPKQTLRRDKRCLFLASYTYIK